MLYSRVLVEGILIVGNVTGMYVWIENGKGLGHSTLLPPSFLSGALPLPLTSTRASFPVFLAAAAALEG